MPTKSEPPLEPVSPQARADWEKVLAIGRRPLKPVTVKPDLVPKITRKAPAPTVLAKIVVPVTQNVVVNRQPKVYLKPQPQPLSASIALPKTIIQQQPKQTKERVMKQGNWSTFGFKLVGYLLLMFLVLFAKNEYSKWTDKSDIVHDTEIATQGVELSKKYLERDAIEAQRRVFEPAKAIISSTSKPVIAQVVYDCQSSESDRQGFNQGIMLGLDNQGSVTLRGCANMVANQEVAEISGENFRMEIPVRVGPVIAGVTPMHSCPSAANPSCTVFWNKIHKDYERQSQPVRVLLLKGGYVTLTAKGV